MTKKNLVISFSGGETSAYMTHRLLYGPLRARYNDILVLFANTGQENEATLEFVKECDEHFKFGTVWLEAEVHHDSRRAPSPKVVDFKTASRNGEPFENAIKKYGIPNQSFKDCTRNLKINPIEGYIKKIGWKQGTYEHAIGIRFDELDRASSSAKDRGLVYPLAYWEPTTKPEINTWWAAQSFRLRLKGYQGNCKWCWKKSLRKHFTLIKESPEIYDFPRRMEKENGLVGAEFRKTEFNPQGRGGKVFKAALPEGYRRVFFRGGISTDQLFELYEKNKNTFIPADDEAQKFDPDFDVGAGCSESCEVYSDEDMVDEPEELETLLKKLF